MSRCALAFRVILQNRVFQGVLHNFMGLTSVHVCALYLFTQGFMMEGSKAILFHRLPSAVTKLTRYIS